MMNMMKNTINIFTKVAAVIAVAFGMSACLSKMPGDAIPESEGMKTFSDAEQTLTGIYSSYMSGALYSGYLTLLPDIQADLVHAVQGNTNTYGPIWEWDVRTTNSEILSVYGSLYSVIARCNYYLDKVGALRESLTSDDDITYLDYYTGEVYCARANAYMELIKCFCEAYDPETAHMQKGVAIDSTYFGTKPQGRSSLKDSYAFVISDLEKAEELLEEDFDYYTNPYVTDAAAKALRARAALYMQDFDTAIEYSTKVIENKNFALSTSSNYTSGTDPISGATRAYNYIDYMWTHDLSTEIIWQIGFTATSYGGSLGQVFLNFNNDYTYFYPDYMPSEWVIGLYGGSDARRTAYFRTVTTGYSGNPALTLLVKYFGNESTFIPNQIYHVCQPKPLRLAEQYLIRAEAYCRSAAKKNIGKASEDLRYLAASRGGSVASINDKNWLKVISDERVKELYMEGFRLNDLKRWKNLPQWSSVESTSGRVFKREKQSSAQNGPGTTLEIKTTDHRFVWPIPSHEIESPGSRIEQNAGY
jgi:hypothetical protein